MNPTAAASAYANAARLAGNAAGDSKPTGPAGAAGSFSDLVSNALESVSESGKATEARAAEMVSGKGDVVDVVTAVAETEVALETLVTVRDKVISAYQDILNMPI